ncbi:MAG: glycosyltransferase family 4 protein [candidate division KSB1 bacterium]
MPRILFYTSSFSLQSGATYCMMHTAQELARQKRKEVLLALPESDAPALAKFATAQKDFAAIYTNRHTYKLSKRAQPFKYLLDALLGVAQLYQWLKKNPAAIVHVNDLLDFHAAIAGRLAGCKVIWHLRTVRPKWMVAPFLLLLRTLSTRVLAVSQATADKMLGKSFRKVTVVYDSPPDANVFDPQKYSAEIRASTRASLDIAETEYVVAMIGKLVRLKGHEYFIRAGKQVIAQMPNTKLVIVGGAVAGHEDYERDLQRLSRELGIASHLIFTGFRNDVPALIAASDVMLQVSIFEDPFPGVVLQGMAMAKPVLASRLGGIPEQIEDAVTGYLVDPHDSIGIAQRIISLLQDASQRERIGQAARKAVYEKFKDDATVIDAIYDEVLKME